MYEQPQFLSATTILGDSVRNPSGEDLGELKELVIDLEHGQIVYAVLSFGGFLGMGDKLFAIPWQALTLVPEENFFILNIDKDILRNAPGFDKEHWPQNSDYRAGWLDEVYDYYGYPTPLTAIR